MNMSTNSAAGTQKAQVLHLLAEERNAFDSVADSKRIAQQIGKETGAQIEMVSAKNQSLIFLIRGKQPELVAARRQILIFFSDPTSRAIVIPKRHHAAIVGKDGMRLRDLEQATATEISIPPANERSDIIIIVGTKEEDVVKAEAEIRQLSADQCTESLDCISLETTGMEKQHCTVSDQIAKEIDFDYPVYGEHEDQYRQDMITFPTLQENTNIVKLRGPREDDDAYGMDLLTLVDDVQESTNIRKTRDGTQTKIDLPGEGHTNEVIAITGKNENVLEAKDRIQNSPDELIDIVTEEVQIPRRYYSTIIGSRGKSLSSLKEESGDVRIKFPTRKSTSDKVVIHGPKDDVLKAKTLILELVNECQAASYTAEVRAKQQHHKFIIGKNGSSIKKIRDATGARIIFPGKNSADKEAITIIGKEEHVKLAKEQLEAIIQDFDQVNGSEISDAQVTIEMVIPQRLHSTVMGARGSKVQQLTSDFNVKIKFPDRNAIEPVDGLENGIIDGIATDEPIRHCDIIRITGHINNCNAAKQALIDLVPITEELIVPYDLHRSFIGPKGANVREFMSIHDVHIEVPPSENKSDIVKVSGMPAKIAAAKKALNKMIEKHEASRADRELRSYNLQIEVDPEYHSKLIGKSGAVINKLRADHDVEISLPRRGSPNQSIITITGYQAKVESARDAIMEIVREMRDFVQETVYIDKRVHSHIIGQRGRNITKLIEKYKVKIHFPNPEEALHNPDAVIISGKVVDVINARAAILKMTESFIQNHPQPEECSIL